MRNLDWQIDVAHISDWVTLWFYGDQHYGAAGCAVDHMKATIAAIKEDPNAYCVLMGDCCDFVNFTDKRFDIKQIAPEFTDKIDDLPRSTADAFIEMHRPLAKKIIGLVPGNHDEKIRINYHFDVAAYIAGSLDIPYLASMAQLRIRVRDTGTKHSYMVEGTVSHAEKGATTTGGKLTAAQRIGDFYPMGEFYAQAHTHEYLVHQGLGLRVRGAFKHRQSPPSDDEPRFTILTGGYLKTYADGPAGYGERKGYRPCVLGSPRLMMRMQRTSEIRHGRHIGRDKKELRAL